MEADSSKVVKLDNLHTAVCDSILVGTGQDDGQGSLSVHGQRFSVGG
jgi:hypothetical protein